MRTNLPQAPDAHEFGKTALTPAEWAELAAKRCDTPYVVVDIAPLYEPSVSPLRTYAEAMADFNSVATWAGYSPDTGRALKVMSQADYLKACEKWSQS